MDKCGAPVRCDGAKAPFVRPRWCRERRMEDFGTESSVQQGFGEQTNINEIVKRFQRTGFMPPQREPIYADVTGLQGDLTELIERSRETIRIAEEFASNWKPSDPVDPAQGGETVSRGTENQPSGESSSP